MTDTPAMMLDYAAPPADLSGLISVFYTLSAGAITLCETERADLAQLRFLFAGAGTHAFACGTKVSVHPVTLIGPTGLPFVTSGTGPIDIFGMGLLPAGWAALVGLPADSCADRAFDAIAMLGDPMGELYRAMSATTGFQARTEMFIAHLRCVVASSDSPPGAFIAAVDSWLGSHLDPRIEDLIAATGLSARQVERMTKRHYGLPPKQLARKYRALRTASALAGGKDLTEAALGDAFYDQSHLIREIKHFTGMTPGEIQRRSEGTLMAETVRGRRSVADQVGPLISDT